MSGYLIARMADIAAQVRCYGKKRTARLFAPENGGAGGFPLGKGDEPNLESIIFGVRNVRFWGCIHICPVLKYNGSKWTELFISSICITQKKTSFITG